MVLSLAINLAVKGGTEKAGNQQLKEQIDKASKPIGMPSASPLSVPAAPQPGAPVKK
jgi:preprotein translocase subunit SecG